MLLPIGQAAARLGLKPSALRYYDERGLVRPAFRRGGKRYYGEPELRRLAFIQLLGRVGVGLDVAEAVLDLPSERWRARTREQIETLERLIAEATAARELLRHALACPSAHPTRECSTMIGLLDRRLAGATFEDLAREHGDLELPPVRKRRPGSRGRREK